MTDGAIEGPGAWAAVLIYLRRQRVISSSAPSPHENCALNAFVTVYEFVGADYTRFPFAETQAPIMHVYVELPLVV